MFLVVTLVQAIKNIGDNMAVQQVSYRRRQAVDHRSIQGAIYANGVGILLSGLAGVLPTTAYSSSSVSLLRLTGVASRRVGYAMGSILVALALLPKATAALLAIPSPVMGAVLLFVTATLFMEGVHTVARGGLNAQDMVSVGLAYAVGVGMMQQDILAGVLPPPWDTLLGDGLTLGAGIAIGMSFFLRSVGPRPRRLRTVLNDSAFTGIDTLLRKVAADHGWDGLSVRKLRSAGEEALLSLQEGARFPADEPAKLMVSVHPGPDSVEMEFVTAPGDENLENRLANLDDEIPAWDEEEVSFRLLRHYASVVRHQKYHGLDVVMVKVDRT